MLISLYPVKTHVSLRDLADMLRNWTPKTNRASWIPYGHCETICLHGVSARGTGTPCPNLEHPMTVTTPYVVPGHPTDEDGMKSGHIRPFGLWLSRQLPSTECATIPDQSDQKVSLSWYCEALLPESRRICRVEFPWLCRWRGVRLCQCAVRPIGTCSCRIVAFPYVSRPPPE